MLNGQRDIVGSNVLRKRRSLPRQQKKKQGLAKWIKVQSIWFVELLFQITGSIFKALFIVLEIVFGAVFRWY